MNPVCTSKHPSRNNTWCDRAPGHVGPHRDSDGFAWEAAPAGSYTRTDEEDWQARAVKAERAAQTLRKVVEDQCRDIARITRSEHMVDADGDADWEEIWSRGHDMATRLEQATDRVDVLREEVARTVRERDEWEANAEQAERALVEMTAHRDQCRDTATKWQTEANLRRPLTPDDITDEMVKRGAEKFRSLPTGMTAHARVGIILTAALTEPTRPEGAEDIETDLRPLDLGGVATPEQVADHLAALGYRKAES